MKTSLVRHTVRALSLLALTASPLLAFDATGTWVGQFSCKHFDGVKFNFKQKPATLEISQQGTSVLAEVEGFVHRGQAQDAFGKPEKGEIFFILCGTDTQAGVDFAEMLRAAVKTKVDKVAASFSGVSIFDGDFGGGQQFGTCKYKFKRTSTADPMVPGCLM